MALFYTTQKVRDYDTWLPYIEADKWGLQATGAKVVSILRSIHDPNEVHFVFDVPDEYAFMTLIQSADYTGFMEQAGAIGTPVMYKLQEF